MRYISVRCWPAISVAPPAGTICSSTCMTTRWYALYAVRASIGPQITRSGGRSRGAAGGPRELPVRRRPLARPGWPGRSVVPCRPCSRAASAAGAGPPRRWRPPVPGAAGGVTRALACTLRSEGDREAGPDPTERFHQQWVAAQLTDEVVQAQVGLPRPHQVAGGDEPLDLGGRGAQPADLRRGEQAVVLRVAASSAASTSSAPCTASACRMSSRTGRPRRLPGRLRSPGPSLCSRRSASRTGCGSFAERWNRSTSLSRSPGWNCPGGPAGPDLAVGPARRGCAQRPGPGARRRTSSCCIVCSRCTPAERRRG